MDELQNIILNSVKNPSYFQQLNINDLIEDESIKDELLNILQIIVTNLTKQNNQLKNYIDEININIDNKINDINNNFKKLNEKLIRCNISLDSVNRLLDSNKVIETNQANSIKISILEKDLNKAQNKYDKIFLDNLFIPNLISSKGTKFKNLKDLLNNNYDEISKIKLIIEKYNQDFEIIKEKQNNKSHLLAIKKMQDLFDEKIKLFENNMKNTFMEYNINQEKILKANEIIFEELKKKNKEFNENFNYEKIKLEEKINQKINNEHALIEAQINNIKILKDLSREYNKKYEKIEQDMENQKILIQKYIRYFELYKYRENFFLQRDIVNKEKKTIKEKKNTKEKNKKIKGKKNNRSSDKYYINKEERNRNQLSFIEDSNNEIINLNFNSMKNFSFDLGNYEKNNLFFYNLFNNDKQKGTKENINNIENFLTINSDIIFNKNKEEKRVIHTNNNLDLLSLPNINNNMKEDIYKNRNNTNLERNLTKSNEIDEKNHKIELKKANLFDHQKLKQLTVNKSNNNYLAYFNDNNSKSNYNFNLNEKNKIIQNENNKINNSYESKIQIDNSLIKKNSNEASSYYTIDNFMENKFHKDLKKENNFIFKKDKSTFVNNLILENNKIIEEKKENSIFKLNVIKLNIPKKLNNIKYKKNENKNHKNIKITSKSLQNKREKIKLNPKFDISSGEYAKIIEKNKIKRVNTGKKLHKTKKIK